MFLMIRAVARYHYIRRHRQRPQYAFKTLVQCSAVADWSSWCRHNLNGVLEWLPAVRLRFNHSKKDKHEMVFMFDEVEHYEAECTAQEPYRFVTSSREGGEWSI